MNKVQEQFESATIKCKANIYFDGKVVSHSLTFADGSKKSIGLVYPGTYKFNTAASERMEIIEGRCRAKVAGSETWTDYAAGTHFDIPADSSFEIEVGDGIVEYICSFG